jgi:glycosyltransferase involved in cell wall biosynthesis
VKIVKAENIDVILATKRKDYWIAGRISKKEYIPVVFRLGIVRKIKSWDLIQKSVYRNIPDVIIVNAKIIGTYLEQTTGVSSEKISVIYNGYRFIDVQPIDISNNFGIPENSFVFGAACRLEYQKGIDILLQSAAFLIQNEPDIYLIIAGEGKEEGRLKELSRSLGIQDRVIFTGFIREIRGLLAALDVVVIPSRFEGIPNTLFEAWSVKKPVVVTKVSGVPEVVNPDQDALMVSPDLRGLEYGLWQMYHSRELMERLAREGYNRLNEDFTEERMLDRIEEVFTRITGMS